jgi:hypothetical protein
VPFESTNRKTANRPGHTVVPVIAGCSYNIWVGVGNPPTKLRAASSSGNHMASAAAVVAKDEALMHTVDPVLCYSCYFGRTVELI